MAFDYTSRDYDSIKQDLFDRAERLIPEWSTRNPSDFGVALVELWAYTSDILHYYIDRAATEAFLDTATQRESLLAYANLFDYEVRGISAASATVTLNVSGTSGTVTIPAGATFTAPATPNRIALTFNTTSIYTGSSSSPIVIPVVEGVQTTDEVVGTSNGTSSQRFSLYYKSVDKASVVVDVYEGVSDTARRYTYTSRLVDASSNQNMFTLYTDANDVTYIVFGNGINGRIPTNGKTIKVSYRRTNGLTGNIEANAIKQLKGTFTGSQYLSVASSTAGYGGANAESVESLRLNIPKVFATLDRAVSLQDFKDLALQVSNVDKVTATNTSGMNVMIYPVSYQSNYVAYSGSTISASALQTPVLTYFIPRTVVGASVGVASTITLTPINITATIYVKTNAVASRVYDAVTAALNTLFTFENVSFGQTFTKGQFYRTMFDVEGVDYVNITTWSYDSGTTISAESYTVDATKLPRKGTFTLSTSGGIV